MRTAALILRAGAVVAFVAIAVAAVVDAPPSPPVVEGALPATPPGPDAVTDPEPVVPQRSGPTPLVTVVATGDIVLGTPGRLPPNDARTFFDDVTADLAGDIVLGNLEGTLSVGGRSKCRANSTDCFAFQSPPRYAQRLAGAGFTILNLANNHAFDFGEDGQRQTITALTDHGLLHTGRPGQIALQDVAGTRVAVVGFASYPWAASLTDITGAQKLVRKADAQADLVVVTFHGGAEGADRQHVKRGTETFLGENRGNLIRFSHAVVDAGADLVVGHGPHVLRGMEWYRGRLIAYSLGNFGGYKVFALEGPTAVSAILRVSLRAGGKFETGVLVATRLDDAGIPRLDPDERAHGLVRRLSREDFGARRVKVGSSGLLTR